MLLMKRGFRRISILVLVKASFRTVVFTLQDLRDRGGTLRKCVDSLRKLNKREHTKYMFFYFFEYQLLLIIS